MSLPAASFEPVISYLNLASPGAEIRSGKIGNSASLRRSGHTTTRYHPHMLHHTRSSGLSLVTFGNRALWLDEDDRRLWWEELVQAQDNGGYYGQSFTPICVSNDDVMISQWPVEERITIPEKTILSLDHVWSRESENWHHEGADRGPGDGHKL